MLLEITKLKKEYQRNGAAFAAVNSVSISVDAADFVCITGRSGSGKSTLLNMIVGLLEPSCGSIAFDGQELSHMDDAALSLMRNTKIGYIPQGHSVLANLSVLDNIRLPFYMYKRDGDPSARAHDLLKQMGISHLDKTYPAQLSGGELRRVAIARSLINSPQLLVADEPTGDLDPQTTEDVMNLLSQVAKDGTAVLLVTHEVGIIHYCNRLFSMESGNLMEVNRTR